MVEELYQHFLKTPKISTDTRKIEKGSIFFALKGPNFNANKFAKEALEKGASYVVIDEEEYLLEENCMLVPDVLTTLQELARHHRKQLNIPFIGLTGSNGKTTTKELISTVLSQKYNVLSTKGNLNNHIGVPLTILSITNEHEIAVIEMGANHVGEIQALCEIALPTHGLITNIGKAHLEGFGGFDGVIRAKSELYHHLIKTNGTVWINSQNEILSNMAKRFKDPLFYPAKGDYYHCEFVGASPFVKIQTDNTVIETNLVGKYNFENIAVALCIGQFFEVPVDKAEDAVRNYTPSNNRSQIIKKGNTTIILDAYNANPSSMASALENLSQMNAEHKAVILGDMKELGENSADEHQKVGELLSKGGLSKVFLFGPEFEAAKSVVSDACFTNDKDILKSEVKKADFKNTVVLIKGSRSMGLEEVVDLIS